MEFNFQNEGLVFGFDEAGRGPLAGPVCTAIVNFHPSTLQSIHNKEILIGLNDSKKLRSKLRENLFDQIIKLANFYHISIVSPRFIDRFNINQAIFYGIRKSVRRIEQKLKHDSLFLLLDGNYRLESNVFEWQPPKYKSIPKADEFIYSVSAASILAKVFRDRLMNAYAKKFPEYGFDCHSGYGTEKHRLAIQKFGISRLHRKSYLRNIMPSET
ncbi:ribonuclease HII [Leptospira sp. GIMC2001]|uniref:ribonuclease HII n=1 Tax=Leptospira sp. GIMC2001 TaxID=1513297 RepID=UPI002349437F|nr:ribonuclease HII [Leptospira sp. GIMC2001]WCL47925.1 ribonuclease HII [Leptospira sp. GIMC2001]